MTATFDTVNRQEQINMIKKKGIEQLKIRAIENQKFFQW